MILYKFIIKNGIYLAALEMKFMWYSALNSIFMTDFSIQFTFSTLQKS